MAAAVDVNNISDQMRKLCVSNFEVNSVHKIYVTHINNPHDFYVMPAPYMHYISSIEHPGSPMESQNIQRGARVIFLSKTKQRPVRGEIYNIDKKTEYCDLRAIDYGFVEILVSFNDLFHLNRHVQQIPPLINNCEVIECYPIGGGSWDPETIDFMKHYVGENMAQIVIKGQLGDKYMVELNNFSNPGLSMEMCLVGLTHLCCGPNTVNKLSHPKPEKLFFTFKNVKVGDQLPVRAVTGKTLDSFYVAEMGDYSRQIEERADFKYWSQQCKQFPMEKVREGAAVLLFDNYSYERGVIKKIVGNKCLVQYVDNGIEKLHNPENFKEMGEKFFRRSAVAIYCKAEESQRVDVRIQKFLYPGFEFTIKILELGDKLEKPHVVQLNTLTHAEAHAHRVPRF